MRKLTLLAFAILAASTPLHADSKHQSYISYDDGGTLVRATDDDREVEARVNLPIFPGDEVITNRRGRAEVRLADGNVVGIDRATAVRFRSILDSYDGDASETTADLRYGKVAVYRIDGTRDYFRLDTPSATYFASDEAMFSVETDSSGRDRVAVLDGVIEVRTPARTTRLRSGEQADIDDRGTYDVASFSRYSADDFERWFLRRAERYGARDSRHLDRSLAYYDDELSRHGSWVNVGHYGWAWRPTVSIGWRPYYNGYWMRARSGCLNWVSYEPWGWVPYHYGRWAHDPFYGWFWVPGTGYAPAWVYWWYGNGYLGWAPAGYWDLHRPYYDWAYRPYHRAGLSIGFGFYGRVRVNDVDLRPWTFVDANTIVSNRIDRAALTTDAIRARLGRDTGGFATISSDPARFTREEFRDPAAAINRRWVGVDTGRATAGPAVDVTPFIRRDANLPGAIRDRVVRNRPSDGGSAAGTSRTIAGSDGGLAPIGRGSVAPIGGGNVAPIGRSGLAPSSSGSERPADAGRDRINRGGSRTGSATPAPAPSGSSRGDGAGRVRRGDDGDRELKNDGAIRRNEDRDESRAWRDGARSIVPRGEQPAARPAVTPEPSRDTEWRGRTRVARPSETPSPAPDRGVDRTPSAERPRSEVPRRVIDRIGGARVQSDDRDRGSSRDRSSPPPRSVDRPSSSGNSAPPPPPRSNDGGGRSNDGGSKGASREDGGRIKRDQ